MAPSGTRTRSKTQYKRQLFQAKKSSASGSSSPSSSSASSSSSSPPPPPIELEVSSTSQNMATSSAGNGTRTRTQYKRKPLQTKKKSASSSSVELVCNSTTTSTHKLSKKIRGKDDDYNDDVIDDVCLTPKGKKYRIPEIVSCPPAPMKKRKVVSNCSSQRSPIPFFTNPDIELFFFFAVHDISV